MLYTIEYSITETTLESTKAFKENPIMTNVEEHELKDRLKLIETMIAEGRRTTESWGWVFILWGLAYYVATAWAAWGHTYLAWPVTMIASCVLTGALISHKMHVQPKTTIGRAIGSV